MTHAHPEPPDSWTSTRSEVDALLWTNERERERARRYHRIRRHIGYLVGGTQLARQVLFLSTGGATALEIALRRQLPHESLVAPVYALILSASTFLLDLPTSYLAGYRIERTFGLTRQPAPDWLRQRLIAFSMGSIVQIVAMTGLHILLRRRPNDWWLVLTVASAPATILASTLVPTVIMPRFNRFTPMADTDLVDRLQRLGEKAGVRIADVYVMDMSRQTERANAMFTGLGGTRRIVLGDTLTERFEPDEIAGVIAHELGHQVNRDIWTLSALGAGSIALLAGVTNRIGPRIIPPTRRWTGIESVESVAALNVLALVATAASLAIAPLTAGISRFIERRTDRFALELTGDGQAYARGMARLGRGNLVDPDPPTWRVRLLASHPPVTDRIAAALRFGTR